MGAPTSSVLSEIYLQFMEHTHFYTTLIQNNDLGYFQYGNDILIVYNESSTNTDTLLDCFNNAMPATTFSIEKELDNSINFLDITVHKKARNFSFSIYQKPTTTDTITPNAACHPHEHKYATIHYMVNRMNNYQLSRSSKEHESNIIRQITYNNKYDPSHQNIRKTKHTIKQDKDNTQKWAKFTYIGKETKFITKLFKNSPVKISFTTNNTIGRILSHRPTRTNHAANGKKVAYIDSHPLVVIENILDKLADPSGHAFKNTTMISSTTITNQNSPCIYLKTTTP